METDKEKRRRAALKAWETIRRKKKLGREAKAKELLNLEQFIKPSEIARIKHPEDTFPLMSQRTERRCSERIIRPFHKTPPDIVCGKFWELRWAFGCPLECAYCYLRGTYRGRISPPKYVKIEHVLKALDEIFSDSRFNYGKPAIINSGELADSLMNPIFMEMIADKFEENDKHKLLLLTKFGTKNIDFLIKKLRKQVICAWSLNAPEVARLWEAHAPSVDDRIEAARLVKETGYTVWLRIDPIFPIEKWENCYERLLQRVFDNFVPDRIILGTPRGLRKTIYYARKSRVDTSWMKYFGEKTGWGLKLPFNLRKTIYTFMRDKLKELGFNVEGRVSICKETVEMWKALRWTYYPGECQCYGEHAIKYS